MAFKLASVLVLVSACLGSEWARNAGLPWVVLNQSRDEVFALCKEYDIQWMVLTCISVYFIGFNWLNRQRAVLDTHTNIFCIGLYAIAMLLYASDYEQASTTTETLVLCFGLVLFAGFRFWQSLELRRNQPFPLSAVAVGSVLLIFCLSVGAHREIGQVFAYHGQQRWSGLWDNPNTFGVLMAAGFVIAVGWAIFSLKSKVQSWSTAAQEGQKAESRRWKAETLRWVGIALLGTAAIICAVGLVKSYSRGAWLGAAVGLSYLIGSAFWSSGFGRYERTFESGKQKAEISCVSWLRRNWLPASVVLASVLILAFWNCRHTEHTFTRRVASAANAKDFSSRNRVAAWEGALQMIADKPFFGYGWNGPVRVQGELYRNPKLDDVLAVQLNDYFLLGATLGISALFCFVAFVGLSLSPKSKAQSLKSETDSGLRPPASDFGLPVICRSAAVILLVGFWFDGGLLKLATEATFWILLALGSVEEVDGSQLRVEREVSKQSA